MSQNDIEFARSVAIVMNALKGIPFCCEAKESPKDMTEVEKYVYLEIKIKSCDGDEIRIVIRSNGNISVDIPQEMREVLDKINSNIGGNLNIFDPIHTDTQRVIFGVKKKELFDIAFPVIYAAFKIYVINKSKEN